MAIKLNTGLDIRTNLPVDKRFVLSKSEMANISGSLMPAKYFAICSEDGKLYIYNKLNEQLPTTGKFRVADEALDARLTAVEAEILNFVEKDDYEAFKTLITTRVENAEINIVELQTDMLGAGSKITLSLKEGTYELTAKLLNKAGTLVSQSTVDLPIESLVKSGYYDKKNKQIVLVLQDGSTINIPVGDLVSDLATKAELRTVENKIPTKTSQLTNDAGFLTEHQSLAAYRTAVEQDQIHDDTKQDKLVAGTNITINGNVISASGSTYVAGENITIKNGVISAKDTKYTAGANITIDDNNVISATGGGSEPEKYLKEAEVSSNTLTLTRKDGSTVKFTPQTGKVYTAGENIQISATNVISATDTIYDDTEVRANIADLQENLVEHIADVNIHVTTAEKNIWNNKSDFSGNYNDLTNKPTIPTKTSELTNDSGFLTEHQSLDNYYNKTAVDTKLAEKQAKLTVGENIQINNNVISATDTKYTAGTNITIVDNVISSTASGGTLTKSITASQDVGGITAGTTFEAGTSIETIITKLLGGTAPTTNVKIYKGVVNAVPTTAAEIEALTLDQSKSKTDLLGAAYSCKRLNPNNQFVVLAIPKTSGLYVDRVLVNGFSIGINEIEIGDYYLYAEEYPVTLTNITYDYYFAEV